MNRRIFLGLSGLTLSGLAGCRRTAIETPVPVVDNGPKEAEIVIIGAGCGGAAAALAACRQGATVLMTEETDWLGGQLTSQAVPPDEHKWIESPLGGAQSYYDLREGVRDYYRKNYPLNDREKANKTLNPGQGWVSRLCAEPFIFEKVIRATLQPFVDSGKLRIYYNAKPVRAEVEGDRVKMVEVEVAEGKKIPLIGKYFLDATEQGDLLPMTGCEFVTGAESRAETDEPNAANEANPKSIQSFTVCCALEYRPGERHVIEKPASYDFWNTFTPKFDRPHNGKLFSWNHPSSAGKFFDFDPSGQFANKLKGPNFWTYRRVLDRSKFGDRFAGDISIINWHQNDYMLGPLHTVPAEEAAKHLEAARQMTLSVVYWLQTESPKPDGNAGWPELRLCGEAIGTSDGLAKYPYIRESRRIKAEFTIFEQHVSEQIRKRMGKAEAEPFPDSVGIGHYPIDLHACSNGVNGGGWTAMPFRIPLGALIPKRMENLVACAKNIGTTHISNGCYRLQPVEWSIGEAAGTLAAFCIRKAELPRRVRNDKVLLGDFQRELRAGGQQLEWKV